GAECENSESFEHFVSFLSSKNWGLCARAAPARDCRSCESEDPLRPYFFGCTSWVDPSRGLEFGREFHCQRGNSFDANHSPSCAQNVFGAHGTIMGLERPRNLLIRLRFL